MITTQFKKVLPGIFFFLLFCSRFTPALSQTGAWNCADAKLSELQRVNNPIFDKLEEKLNRDLKIYTDYMLKDRDRPFFNGRITGDSVYTIPVVVHVVHPAGESYGTGTNISYAQIKSQLEALNAAFSKNYPAYNGQTHPAYAQNVKIRFCLARNTMPSNETWYNGPGGIEFGIKRYAAAADQYNNGMSVASATRLLNLTHPLPGYFPFESYLNIWVVKTIDGGNNVIGYAPRPIVAGFPLDGIVIRADVFGDNTTGSIYSLGFGLEQGKVLVHEAGHYLNLYHIFQGGCAGTNAAGSATDACDLNGDMICDIEPSTTQNVFCYSGEYNTCSANYPTGTTSLDMINDYMSYADDNCMNTFTLNQAQRMWATLNIQRQQLWDPVNLAATGVLGINGCIPPYLNAQISTNNSALCKGSVILFSNPPAGNTATSYQWLFPGGSPASATGNTASVTYAAAGNYKAILTVSDGTITRKDSLPITILDCRLDSSKLSWAHWYFGNFCSLDFSTGRPVQTTTALDNHTIQYESAYPAQPVFIQATTSLSDSTGQLLFYSNSVSVWNKLHQKISTSPVFGAADVNASTGVCYIPYPGQPGKYFMAGASANVFSQCGIRIVLVDLNTNTVFPYQEFNHPSLPAKFSEFLTVVPHCNGKDYWIVTKGYGPEDTKFYSFLVTAAGPDINQLPVISSGFLHPGFQGSGNQLKSNRKGDKLFLSSPHGTATMRAGAIYNFDNNTGKVSNEMQIPDNGNYSNIQSGAAFSPNDEYFYLIRSSNFSTNGPPYWLFQYRVSDMQYNIIPAPGFYYAAPFQQGPDNQIYIATQDNYIARISNPDKWGEVTVDGSFIRMTSLNPIFTSGVSLPSFIDAGPPIASHPDFTVRAVNCSTFRVSVKCFDNYTASWNFNDGTGTFNGNSVLHSFTAPGDYNITLTLSSASSIAGTATKKVTVFPFNISISGPFSICTNGQRPVQYFAPVLPGVKYQWAASNGSISGLSNQPFVDVTWSGSAAAGTIQLTISRDSCTLTDSRNVTISQGAAINWYMPPFVCLRDSAVQLLATPPGGNFSGPGVSNGLFSPAAAGPGTHQLFYTYADEVSCLVQAEKKITVKDCSNNANPADICLERLNGIRIIPNPVTATLVLQSPYPVSRFRIINAAGQTVTDGLMISNKVNMERLAAGMYILQVFCPEDFSSKSFRFMKQ